MLSLLPACRKRTRTDEFQNVLSGRRARILIFRMCCLDAGHAFSKVLILLPAFSKVLSLLPACRKGTRTRTFHYYILYYLTYLLLYYVINKVCSKGKAPGHGLFRMCRRTSAVSSALVRNGFLFYSTRTYSVVK